MDKPRLSFWQILIELGGASGAPPRPPARSAGVNPAPLAAWALVVLCPSAVTVS